MTKLNTLYADHETAEALFAESSDPHVKNELAQLLCCTRDLIYRLESGEAVPDEEIDEIVVMAQVKLEAAYRLSGEVADTLRSEDISLTK